jgi:hypothetical protein
MKRIVYINLFSNEWFRCQWYKWWKILSLLWFYTLHVYIYCENINHNS